MQLPKFDFNDPKTPFFTSPRFLPPTKVEKCKVYACKLKSVLDLYLIFVSLLIKPVLSDSGCNNFTWLLLTRM